METETSQNQGKKKLPTWIKLMIVLAIIGVGLTVIASVGVGLVASYLSGKGGKRLVEKGIEKLVEKGIKEVGGGKADVEITKEGLIVKDKEGGQQLAVQVGQHLPAGFPGDLPVFSPAEITGSVVIGPMTMVTLESPRQVQEIASFYQRELPRQGWASTFTATPEAENFAAVYRKEGRQVTLNLSPPGEEGKTTIGLGYSTVPMGP